MKRIIAFVLAVMMTVVLLAGCGSGGKERRVVNVCSWGEYIDESLIGEFESQTGIHVNYQTAESNETLYSLLQTGGADFDVIVPSDYMIGRLIDEGMLAELDYSAIPNYDLIDPQYKSLSFDPENKYTVPYTWGTVGIIYNTKMVDEPITSWGAMFDEKYAGQVLMINNSRDALMAALCYLGYDINTTDEAQLTEAFELVKNAKDKGVYQAFVMDEIFGKMEGDNWFVDAMCVLKSSQHKDEAMEWINFIAGTDASLANMDYIWYASPNAEALAEYPAYYEEQNGEALDQELYNIMAAPADVLERCELYVNLPQETLKFYDKLWTKLGV